MPWAPRYTSQAPNVSHCKRRNGAEIPRGLILRVYGEVAPPDDDPGERTRELGGVSSAEPVKLEPGALLADRYQIEAVIGEGGSGQVFRAWDRVLGEPIALKILRPDRARERSWIKRLAREVKVARAIRHPNVCRVFELGHADGHWFITMELATGKGLRELLRGGGEGARPLAERLEDARAFCAGLAAIHAVGIIHRDVTPQNVLRMADGRLVLSDFGLAIEATSNTTMHGGTPSYMPPETAMGGRADQRSDVWAAGAILHEMFFGRRPEWRHAGERVTMIWPLPPGASPVEEELARLCEDCLAQNPANRPATAMAVVGRLAAAEMARPRTLAQRLALRVAGGVRRHRRLVGAAAGLLALGAVARGVQILTRPPLCRAGSEKLGRIWDGSTKAVVRSAFERTGKAYADSTLGSVDRLLEHYLSSWASMYTEACEATHVRGEQSAEILDLRMSCLADRLNGVRSLSELLTRADAAVVDNAVAAADALGSLERCADPRLLRALLPPPEAPDTRHEVERIRRGIADAKALHDAGSEKLAALRMAELVADARRVGYGPVLAEALALGAQIEHLAGRNDAAGALFKEAVWQAEAARYDDVKALAATQLVFVMGRRARYEEAEDWAAQADATLKRIGGHDQIRAWLETNLGELRRWQGRNEEAIAHQEHAIQLKERAGASRADVIHNLNDMALDAHRHGAGGGGDLVHRQGGGRRQAGARRRASAGRHLHLQRGGDPRPAGPAGRCARRVSPRPRDRGARVRQGQLQPRLSAGRPRGELPRPSSSRRPPSPRSSARSGSGSAARRIARWSRIPPSCSRARCGTAARSAGAPCASAPRRATSTSANPPPPRARTKSDAGSPRADSPERARDVARERSAAPTQRRVGSGGIGPPRGMVRPLPACAENPPRVEDDLSAPDCRARPGGQLAAGVDAVPGAREQVGVANRAPLARLPDDQVGVGPDLDRPLARIEAEQAGGVGRREGHEALERQPPGRDPLRVEQRQHGVQLGHAGPCAGDVELRVQLELARPGRVVARDGVDAAVASPRHKAS